MFERNTLFTFDSSTRPEGTGPYATMRFTALMMLSLFLFKWDFQWLSCGAGILQFFIILGALLGRRILPSVHIYPLLLTLNVVYGVARTSWLLYGIFKFFCYSSVLITCLYQFSSARIVASLYFRTILQHSPFLHFTNDKIAYFDIPAIEIDTGVSGLMICRGITFSVWTLSIIVHGVEVGLKLSDDLELAFSTEEIKVSVFRSIEIGDCYANLKGGKYEMTFGKLDERTGDDDDGSIFTSKSPILKAAFKHRDLRVSDELKTKDEATEVTTDGTVPKPKDFSAKEIWSTITEIHIDDAKAKQRYSSIIGFINDTNYIRQSKKTVEKMVHEKVLTGNVSNSEGLRACIASNLHRKASVPHPPSRSIRVSTLNKLMPPWLQKLLHRSPLLIRLSANIMTRFHPISISSITTSGSGKWLSTLWDEKALQFDGEETQRMKKRILNWISEGNFALEMCKITMQSEVPINPAKEVISSIASEDVIAYRTIPSKDEVQQISSIGGGDTTLRIPTFLLPHHEHLLPPPPTPPKDGNSKAQKEFEKAHSESAALRTKRELEHAMKDEANIKFSTRLRLPAVFSEELRNFLKALLKTVRIAQLEKEPDAMEAAHGIKEWSAAVNKSIRDDFKKTVITGPVYERLISRLLSVLASRLEKARGDMGYTSEIPVELAPFRQTADTGTKLLP